jgi:hypothetical protein
MLPRIHRIRFHLLLWTILVALVLPAEPAHASDRVDRLARQMLGASDNKVRLSAALNLARTGDSRAIPAFVRALRDSDESVRGVAATALGRLVTADTPMDHRERVLAALRRVGQSDSEAFVRERARHAFRGIRALPEPAVAAPAVYVDVGPMSDDTRSGSDFRPAMRQTISTAIQRRGGELATEWPGGNPSRAQLQQNGAQAFHVDGTLTELTTETRGRNTVISCKVSMLIATYPEKSMFGFLNGGANVQTGSSPAQVERGQRDCVLAVVENLVTSRVIPTIEDRVR